MQSIVESGSGYELDEELPKQQTPEILIPVVKKLGWKGEILKNEFAEHMERMKQWQALERCPKCFASIIRVLDASFCPPKLVVACMNRNIEGPDICNTQFEIQ